jgi:hypothetical protein
MIRKLALVVALSALLPAAAMAGPFQTFGPHIGFSTDPSQVVFGGQLQMGDIAPQIDFVPGVDVGLGDNLTIISLNGDFHYRFVVQGMTWQPYAGGGVAVHFLSFDSPGPLQDNSDTVAEGTLIGGADVPTKNGSRFFVEGKIGLGDGPDFKVMAGWHFKLH